MTHACPICATPTDVLKPGTPYFICPTCDLWHQDPAPEKLLHGPHEAPPEAMSEGEKAANRSLAEWLLANALGGKRVAFSLDIGAAYPVLARSLRDVGAVDVPVAIDPDPKLVTWARELDVSNFVLDFEAWDVDADPVPFPRFDLITMIHSFEHMYDPRAAFHKLRSLIAKDGVLFIRMPDHRVPGIERDLNPNHYLIHPFVHTFTSILQACAELGDAFTVAERIPLRPGQSDLILRPM